MTEKKLTNSKKWKILPYPEKLLYDVLVEGLAVKNPGHHLREDQITALSCAMETLEEQERQVIERRYQMREVYREIGESMNLADWKCQQICAKALRKLRNPIYVRKYRAGID